MIGDDLFGHVKTIRSREDFVKFVECLNDDYRAKQAEWENKDLQSFLSSLSGFTTNMAGYHRNIGEPVDVESISWRIAAEMLLAATAYGAATQNNSTGKLTVDFCGNPPIFSAS